MTDYEKNINSGSCEKYLEWDEFNVTFRQMIIVPLNETAKKLGARIMLQKPSNIRILGALFVAERMTVKELSEAASISFANIAKHIDELIDEGLVVRYENPENRRYIVVEITDKAKALNEEYERIVGVINECYFKKFLSEKEISDFRNHLVSLRQMACKMNPTYLENFHTMDDVEAELAKYKEEELSEQ